MKKEKEKVVLPTNEDKPKELFKDFDFSKLTRDYIRLAPVDELLTILKTRSLEEWLKDAPSNFKIKDFFEISVLYAVSFGAKTITEILNYFIIKVIYIIYKNKLNNKNNKNKLNNINNIKIQLSQICKELKEKKLIEEADKIYTGKMPAIKYSLCDAGLRRLFYCLLPPNPNEATSDDFIEKTGKAHILLSEYFSFSSNLGLIHIPDLAKFSLELWDYIQEYPDDFFEVVYPTVAKDLSLVEESELRFTGIDRNLFKYRDLARSEALGKLFYIEGNFISISPPFVNVKSYKFVCPDCGFSIDSSTKKISRCSDCGRKMVVVSKKTADFSEAEIEGVEAYSNIIRAEGKRTIDLKKAFESNFQRQKIIGVLKSESSQKKSTLESFFIDFVSFEPKIEVPNFYELSSNFNVIARHELYSRFCRRVVGLKSAKIALLAVFLRSGRVRRERLNLLLFGDSGLGKSFLLEQSYPIFEGLIPISQVDYSNSSLVGLLGGAFRNESGRWALKKGALAKSHQGLCFIEELPVDTVGAEKLDSLKQTIESGKIFLSKATLNLVFPAEVSLIATANPLKGKLDMMLPASAQCGFTPAFLSRFDIKLCFFQKETNPGILDSFFKDDTKDDNFLRNYLFHARKIEPAFNPESERLFKSLAFGLSARKGRSIFNFCKALAQLEFSSVVSVSNVNESFSFFEEHDRIFFGEDSEFIKTSVEEIKVT